MYHDDLRHIEDPRRLDALRCEDAFWQPWRPVGDEERAEEVMANVQEAVGLTVPLRRALVPQSSSIR